jgi:hypothetical protein
MVTKQTKQTKQRRTKNMAKRMTGEQLLGNMSSGSGGGLRDILVNLKVDANKPEAKIRIRPIGDAITYREAQSRKRNENDPKGAPVQVDFPDKDQTKAFTRICADDLSQDYWTQNGFISSERFAINVILRGATKDEPDQVKILAKGKTIFEPMLKQEVFNKGLNVDLLEQGEEPLWTSIGAEEAPDWQITATYTGKPAPKQVEYDVKQFPRTNKIKESEIELLRSVGQPTAEQLAALRKENPALASNPDWMFYGYNLEEKFAPTPFREKKIEESTSSAELTMSMDEEEDMAPVTPSAVKAGKKSAKAPVIPADELDDDMDATTETDDTELDATSW